VYAMVRSYSGDGASEIFDQLEQRNDEIKELLMQTAIYCGVPDANTAFRIAAKVLAQYDDGGAQTV